MPGYRTKQLPVLGAGAVIFKGGSVLLVKRRNEPSRGLWSLPGGVVEAGERVRETVAREVREETGITVRVGSLVGVFEKIVRKGGRIRFHFAVLDYLATPLSGRLRPASDADDARWVPIPALGRYRLSRGVSSMIARALRIAPHPSLSPLGRGIRGEGD